MENCSVKQYKTAVNNPNLEYFDALQFSVDWTKYTNSSHDVVVYNATLGVFIGGIGAKIKILSNGYVYTTGDTDPKSEWTMDGSAVTRYIKPVDATKPTEFLVCGLQKITRLRFNYINGVWLRNPKNLVYCRNLTAYDDDNNTLTLFRPYSDEAPYDSNYIIDLAIDKENVTEVKNISQDGTDPTIFTYTSTWKDFVNVTILNYYAYITYGNISELANLTKLTRLDLRKPDLTGDIASLGNMTSLTLLHLNGSSVSGSIEDFVAAQYSATTNPRKSASGATRIQMYFDSHTNITLGGIRTTIQSKYLAWDDGGSAPTNIRFENS